MEHEGDDYTNCDCCFCTVTNELLEGLDDLEVGGRVETIQTTALLRTARILRRVLENWGDLLSLKLQGKTISVSWCKKTLKYHINNNDNNNICKSKGDCPIGGKCNMKNVEYKATIFTKETEKEKKHYIGISSVRWKLK